MRLIQSRTICLIAMVWSCAVVGPAACARAESDLVVDGLVTSAVEVDVPARAEGPLTEVLVKEGQLVKVGETVGTVEKVN